MVIIVRNDGKVARLLGELGHIKPGETRFFEGDHAEKAKNILAMPAFHGIIGKPNGLAVFEGAEAFDLLTAQLVADPTKVAGLDLGTAVALIEHLKGQGNTELLDALKPYATKPQLATLFP